MESLKAAFFEDPFYAYVALAVLAAALAVAWHSRRTRRLLLALLLVGGVAAGVYLLERAVVTDRERIRAALDDIARAVERGDLDAAGAHLDDRYSGWGVGSLRIGKTAAVLAAKVVVETYKVRRVQYLGRPEITVSDGRADCRLRTVVHYGPEGDPGGRALLAWQVEWVRRTEGWRIRRATRTDDVLP